MNNRRKGFTLVELVITLTLTALVGGMIVSFCVLINDRVRKNSELTTQIEELTSVRSFIERWVAEFDRENTTFVVGSSSNAENRDGVFLYARASAQADARGIGYLQLSDEKIRAFFFEKQADESLLAVEKESVAAALVTEITAELFAADQAVYEFSVRYTGGIERFAFLVNRRTVSA